MSCILFERGPLLLAEGDQNDALLIEIAWTKLETRHPVRWVEDTDSTIEYLAGRGRFADRSLFPFPSVLLLDLYLSGAKGGLEVLRWLNQYPEVRARLPVVVLDSVGQPAEMREAVRLGVTAYWPMPGEPRRRLELLRWVAREWLGEQDPHPALQVAA